MLKSNIEVKHGSPRLFIEGTCVPSIAYTTYFEERSGYEAFIKAGYRIFFVNVSFTKEAINSFTGFSPFRVGVFDDAAHPDYSEFEDAVRKILRQCPHAIIFPRINISMPRWWTEAHPKDSAPTPKGGDREVMFSEAFRAGGEELLVRLIRHIKASDYAHRVGGWMLCGGQTQEWVYRGMDDTLCDAAKEPYRIWAKKTYGVDNAALPGIEEYHYSGTSCPVSENAKRFSIFCNLAMAETLNFFARVTKRETDFEQVVGAFYGYTFEPISPLCGSYALRALIDTPYLDFFSSPNAYTMCRDFGIDWADMMPVDSIRRHGKLSFMECDIRTYLTAGIQKARPGEYPDDIYTTNGVSVWVGPPTVELSRQALRKCFAHQITKRSAIWWFDMWGGWYDDPVLMEELAKMKTLYDQELLSRDRSLSPEVVFFADERGYADLFCQSPRLKGITHTRTAMGNTGVPYDSCMVEDADSILGNYKAAVFPMPIPSEAGKHAMKLCDTLGIPYLTATPDRATLTTEELQAFYKRCGLHFYTDEKDVVYVGNGYIGLHSNTGGTKTLKLPAHHPLTPIFGAAISEQTADTVTFTLKENATALFAVCQ